MDRCPEPGRISVAKPTGCLAGGIKRLRSSGVRDDLRVEQQLAALVDGCAGPVFLVGHAGADVPVSGRADGLGRQFVAPLRQPDLAFEVPISIGHETTVVFVFEISKKPIKVQ
jgi:hypothetical protein